MRCRRDMPPADLPLCDVCREQLEPAGVEVAAAAYRGHQATGCSCDPKYIWTCRQFLKAMIPGVFE